MVHAMTKVYVKYIVSYIIIVYGLSVDLMIFDLGWPLTLDDI